MANNQADITQAIAQVVVETTKAVEQATAMSDSSLGGRNEMVSMGPKPGGP